MSLSRTLELNCPLCGVVVEFRITTARVSVHEAHAAGRPAVLRGSVQLLASCDCGRDNSPTVRALAVQS